MHITFHGDFCNGHYVVSAIAGVYLANHKSFICVIPFNMQGKYDPHGMNNFLDQILIQILMFFFMFIRRYMPGFYKSPGV